jgi:major membrane immunogen (membrane-anchored lipoprotein)
MFKIIFAVFAAIALMACNKAENLEPLLQGAWNNSGSGGWTQVRFSNGVMIAAQGQKSPLQGKYKLEDKTLKLEMYASVGGKQVKQTFESALIEKVDGSTLELKLNGQSLSFVKDIP